MAYLLIGYICKCNTLFSGTRCEVNISPCVSNPCLYGGTCIQNNLDYICECRGEYSGQRYYTFTTITKYCKGDQIIPNAPCVSAGVRLDHTAKRTRARMVDCVLTVSMDQFVSVNRDLMEKGWINVNIHFILDMISSACLVIAVLCFRCTVDVDECLDRPCLNNGRCVNTHGFFNCSCPAGFSGRLCEMDTEERTRIVSFSWNSRLAELIGTLAFLTAFFALTLLLLVVWKGACKPVKIEQGLDKYSAVDSYIQSSSVYNQARQGSCVDTPPQVPVRPISYTPSVPGEGRNKRDSTEFCSFMTDPLFGLKKTVAVCSVTPNLPHHKASHLHSQNDFTHQTDWDDEYDG